MIKKNVHCFLSNVPLSDSSQGAPGNRGFPGQDGLAGAKVGLDLFPEVTVQSNVM